MNELVAAGFIERRIYGIRGKQVMLDRDLAELYGVPTKVLNQAVKRNPGRFPKDFMLQLTSAELSNWKSRFVTSNSSAKRGLRYRPYAFTSLGVAMLSSVLSSDRAIDVNRADAPSSLRQPHDALTASEIALRRHTVTTQVQQRLHQRSLRERMPGPPESLADRCALFQRADRASASRRRLEQNRRANRIESMGQAPERQTNEDQ